METSTDPRALYRDIVEVEKQLRELLRSNPLNAQDANTLRRELMDKAQRLVQVAPALAAQREVEQVLWKPCFYKRIEDFRRRIRKYAAAASSDRSVRDHFARVSQEFFEFLMDAASFYDQLRASYTQWILQHPPPVRIASANGQSPANGSADHAAAVDKCRTSLHRCLVFLGDIARYKELHSQRAKKNFVAAENFYYKALAVIPENGNPHNQLAVLATYVEAETVAVYRYCRSLLIAQPFATADENLALLFERSRQRPLAPPTAAMASVSVTSNAKDKSAALKSFLHRLTRLHGALFSIATKATTPSSSSSSTPAVYSKEMESLLMKELLTLLGTGIVGDALLIKLVVTNIFCIERASGTSAADDALRLSVRMVTVLLEFLRTEVAKAPTLTSNEPLPNALRVISAVSTFCDYVRYNSRIASDLDAFLNRASDSDLGKRAVKDWLEALVQLLNHSNVKAVVQASVGEKNDNAWRELQLQLKENVELRGFKPLSPLLDATATHRWRDDLASNSNGVQVTKEVSDTDAWKVRVWNVHRFATYLCEHGNAILYYYKGEFSTAPSIVSDVLNGSSSSASNAFSAPLGLFGVAASTSSNGGSLSKPLTKSPPAAADDDEFDDEIIVFQPSPSLTPSQPRGEGSSALGGRANSVFGSDPFSLGNRNVFGASPATPPVAPPPPHRHSIDSSSLFGSFNSGTGSNSSLDSGSAVGSSLGGYPGFSSFGNLGGFSGQGLLGSPWQSAPAPKPAATSPLTSTFGRSLSGSVPTSPDFNNSSSTSLFGAMDDLAAIERASSIYQQKESSLSAFLTPSRVSSSPAPAWGGVAPLPVRSASVGGGSSRPPPGFSKPAPPGFGTGVDPAIKNAPPSQFFTRNPFANP